MSWLVSITKKSTETKKELEKTYDQNWLVGFFATTICFVGVWFLLFLTVTKVLVQKPNWWFLRWVAVAIVVVGLSILIRLVFSFVLLTGLRSLAYVFNHTPCNKFNTSFPVDPGSIGTREIRLSTRLTVPACIVCWISSGCLLVYVVLKMVILTFRTDILGMLDPRIIGCSFAFPISFVCAVFFSLCNLEEIGEKFFDISQSIQPTSSDIEKVQPNCSDIENTLNDQNIQPDSSDIENTLNG